jgi:transposase-like protein
VSADGHRRTKPIPPSLRGVAELIHERGFEISHETARFDVNRFGPLFAPEVRRRRVDRNFLDFAASEENARLTGACAY